MQKYEPGLYRWSVSIYSTTLYTVQLVKHLLKNTSANISFKHLYATAYLGLKNHVYNCLIWCFFLTLD